ncbi:ArgJ: glutamate N-acetyltransferase/amino-acid acetyltransferase [Rubrobacter radiotolerans]|uniref:Arginine biosynthesis bifunctional protein ArgJ n=2 Tax=Rubrobacter radiotolerans TaxID=42256 RepID=A0A023X5X9_RUBRA|nr:ArgJ: glutamate N-acetyltransferase/amino-acid acetyltransferase [Rubrobacter radiotolerans]SMC07209.1 glutamate N-acetyltransferase [Rubrobacter radiotolerans DSM 5868]
MTRARANARITATMNKDSGQRIKFAPGEALRGKGATAAEGFFAAGVSCGVRRAGELDLGLLFSGGPCVAAGAFTRNAFRGAPVGVTEEAVADGTLRAVAVNSGNANAATGAGGVEDARRMQTAAAEALGVEVGEVAVASTGVIGERLPVEKVEAGILDAAGRLGAGDDAFAEAILTTDTRPKQASATVRVAGKTVTVGGTAKGSGMIHPNMGTMLAFLTTDASVEREYLNRTFLAAVERSFNRVTVDGDTSPSDLALVLANGASGNEPLDADHPDAPAFAAAVEKVCVELARAIARDGEGATKLVTVVVRGAADEKSAAALAKSVAGSSLVKAAVFGEDANWGRALNALGYSGVAFDVGKAAIRFGEVEVFRGGEPVPHETAEANAQLSGEEVVIEVELGEGESEATAWGCDLTYGYVEINGSYRT